MKEPNLTSCLGMDHKVDPPIPLRVFLSNIEPNVYVAIGAGSSFFYIGKASGFTELAPYIDFVHALRACKYGKTAPEKYEAGMPISRQNVIKYWSRHLNDEPPMWCIETDGREIGDLWLLSEVPAYVEKLKKILGGA